MQKISIIYLMLFLIVQSALGQMIQLESNEAYFYIEFKSLTIEKEIRQVWVMSSYKEKNEFGDFSHRKLIQVNCINKQYRNLQSIYYLGRNGNGKVSASSNDPKKWIFTSPNSIIDSIHNEICSFSFKK